MYRRCKRYVPYVCKCFAAKKPYKKKKKTSKKLLQAESFQRVTLGGLKG
jgi:hypothetical protein